MAYVYQFKRKNGKIDPVWRIQYRDWSGCKRKIKGTTSKRESERLASELEARHALIRKGEIEPPRKRHEAPVAEETVKEYLAWGDSQGGRGGRPWSKVHSRMRRTYLNWWLGELNPHTLIDLEGCLPAVERSLRELQRKGRAGRTVAQYAETIMAFINYCLDREYMAENPLRKLARIDTTPQSQRRALTLEELTRLLDAAPVERRLLYEVACCTGLRANELRNLSIDDLDSDRNGLRLDASWTKNRRSGFQPLPADLVRRLVEFHQSGTIQTKFERFYCRKDTQETPKRRLLYILSNPVKALDVDLKAAGIPKCTDEGKVDFHALRVAYATFLIETGATIKEAQTLLRHSTPYLTMNVYAKVRQHRLGDVVERLGKSIHSPTAPQQHDRRGQRGTPPVHHRTQLCPLLDPFRGGTRYILLILL